MHEKRQHKLQYFNLRLETKICEAQQARNILSIFKYRSELRSNSSRRVGTCKYTISARIHSLLPIEYWGDIHHGTLSAQTQHGNLLSVD